MSEAKEATEAGGKKKGKLPIILVLVLVIAGGGFFFLKGKKPKKVEAKLSNIMIEVPEVLTNLADRSSYVKATLVLQLKEVAGPTDYSKDDFEKVAMPAVQDAITMVLSMHRTEQIFSNTYRPTLRAKIAEAINAAVKAAVPKKDPAKAEHADEKDEESGDDKDSKNSDKEKPKSEDTDHDKSEDKKAKKKPEGWDSADGPVLKVYFKGLATQ